MAQPVAFGAEGQERLWGSRQFKPGRSQTYGVVGPDGGAFTFQVTPDGQVFVSEMDPSGRERQGLMNTRQALTLYRDLIDQGFRPAESQ